MKSKLGKVSAAVLAAALSIGCMTGCTGKDAGQSSVGNTPEPAAQENNDAAENSEEDRSDLIGVDRPKSISMMADTVMTVGNGIDDVLAKYREYTGIDLEVEKIEHASYYEEIEKAFSNGNVADVIEIGTTYYPNYAEDGRLWDMTDAYEKSQAPVKSIINEKYIEAVKIDNKLYGFPAQGGGGTVTYVRGDWMEELGIKNPTNYDEFIEMLKKFKTKESNIIPFTAPGAINSGAPYTIYLREFYQDANPDFYKDSNSGRYIDGMTQPAMKAALQRLQDAYSENLLDGTILSNDTKAAREKFFAGNVGCFSYWAGSWNVQIDDKLQANIPEGKTVPLVPIKEARYIERPSTVYSITKNADNKIGIYKYLIEFMHDGGDGQMLFTHGVEGIHWEKSGDNSAVKLPSRSKPKELFSNAFFDAELSITNFDDPIVPDERTSNSLEIFNSHSKVDEVPYATNDIKDDLADVNKKKKEIINMVVLNECTVDEGIAKYEKDVGKKAQTVIDALNEK